MGRIQSLQVMRAVAALLVVHTHARNLAVRAGLGAGVLGYGHFGNVGASGVDLFFVISGAIIYHTAFRQTPSMSASEFYWRRFVRVAPLNYILSAVWIVLGIVWLGQTFSVQRILATVTFWPAWPNMQLPAISVGGTLCFEALFYAGAGLLLVSRRWGWALALGYVIAWRLREAYGWAPARFLGSPMVLEFLMGAAVMRWRARLNIPPWVALVSLGLGFAALVLPVFPAGLYDLRGVFWGDMAGYRVLALGVPAAVILMSTLALEPFVKGRAARIAVYLGAASYSLYLTHWVLFQAVQPLLYGSRLSADLVIATAIVSAAAIACLVYRFVEKPLLEAMQQPKRRSALVPAE